MVAHRMMVVFGAETARPPTGMESPVAVMRSHSRHPNMEDAERQEAICRSILTNCVNSYKPAARTLHFPGKGCGFLFERSPYCCYANRDGVHVLFTGEVSEWPGIDCVQTAHNAFLRNDPPLEDCDASWLLDFYSTFNKMDEDDMLYSDILGRVLDCLTKVRGGFSFVVYDDVNHRVLAARDTEGAQPLYWGTTDEGQLLFGTSLDDLASCQPTATIFPAGSLFASERHTLAYNPGPTGWVIEGDDYPGQVLSFIRADNKHWRAVKAIPRVTSKGAVCGAVFKVSSQPDFAHPVRESYIR